MFPMRSAEQTLRSTGQHWPDRGAATIRGKEAQDLIIRKSVEGCLQKGWFENQTARSNISFWGSITVWVRVRDTSSGLPDTQPENDRATSARKKKTVAYRGSLTNFRTSSWRLRIARFFLRIRENVPYVDNDLEASTSLDSTNELPIFYGESLWITRTLHLSWAPINWWTSQKNESLPTRHCNHAWMTLSGDTWSLTRPIGESIHGTFLHSDTMEIKLERLTWRFIVHREVNHSSLPNLGELWRCRVIGASWSHLDDGKHHSTSWSHFIREYWWTFCSSNSPPCTSSTDNTSKIVIGQVRPTKVRSVDGRFPLFFPSLSRSLRVEI